MDNVLQDKESIAGTLQPQAAIARSVKTDAAVNGVVMPNSAIDAIISDDDTIKGNAASKDSWNMELTSGNTLAANLTLPPTGAGGTNDYEELINKPKINNITLIKNKTFEDLGLLSLSNMELEQLLQ